MSEEWKKTNKLVKSVPNTEVNGVSSDVPISTETFFPKYTKEGVVTEVTAEYPKSEDMDFGYRNQIGEEIGGIATAIYGMKKAIDWTGKYIPLPQTRLAKAATWGIPYVAGVVSSWVGGAGGELIQGVAAGEVKKGSWAESLDKAWDAGNRQAIYEALGQAGFAVVGKGLKLAAGDNYKNIDWIRQQIKASGGKLTASQVVDGTVYDTVEGLAEAAWGGSVLRQARVDMTRSIDNYVNSYQNNFLEAADATLNTKQLGRLYQDAHKVADSTHRAVGGQKFKDLQELYTKKFRKEKWTKVDESPILDPAGKNFETVTKGVKKVEIQPVSTKALKSWARTQLKLLKGSGKAGAATDWRYKEFERILKMDDKIAFDVAQEMRSSWLAKSRNFDNKVHADYNTKDSGAVQQLSRQMDIAMDTGARGQGAEFYKEFRAANKFWKTGKEHLHNKFMAKIIAKNPEEIGEAIFKTGNQAEIQKARIALRYMQKVTKGTDEAVNFNKVWQSMQTGYLKSILGGATDTTATQLTEMGVKKQIGSNVSDVEARGMNINKLKDLFIENTPTNDTFKAAFTEPQRNSIKNFISALEGAQRKTKGTGTFMVTVSQAQLVLTVPAAAFAMADPSIVSVGGLAVLTVFPAALARILTNPKYVEFLSQGMHTGIKSKTAGGITAKLVAMWTDIGQEQYGELTN